MANKGFIQIEFDKASFDNVKSQLDGLKSQGGMSAYRALMKVAFKIKAEAQLRLTGRGHVVTSRLKNSIFVKSKKMSDVIKGNNKLNYSDKNGKSYSADLSVSLNDLEFAIGTNVEYGEDIELGSRPHTIVPKNGKALSWMPKVAGKMWVTGKNRSTLKSYFKDKSGENSLTNQRVFAQSVKHPGYAGDSFLYWAMKNVNVSESVAKDMQNDLKFGKFTNKPTIYDTKGAALTDKD